VEPPGLGRVACPPLHWAEERGNAMWELAEEGTGQQAAVTTL